MKAPIRAIHQIEITSHCNLACRYCIHKKMPRPKQHMDRPVFERALELAARCVRDYRQNELNLAGTGESTMHPDIIEWVGMARKAVGRSCRLVFATNGVSMTDEIAEGIAPYGPDVYVSMHRPEVAKHARDRLMKLGILAGVSSDPTEATVNWAGQVKGYEVTAAPTPCPWIPGGWVIVLSDGRLSTCCFDGDGSGVVGTVWDDIDTLSVQPYKLCETCHQTLPG